MRDRDYCSDDGVEGHDYAYMVHDTLTLAYGFYPCSKPVGAHPSISFTAVDHEPAVFTRNLVLLQLFLSHQDDIHSSPIWDSQDPVPTWLGQAFNCFFNHGLTEEESDAITNASGQLLEAMTSIESWESSAIGEL